MKERRAMVDSNDTLSMRRQCELLGVNRSSLYYVLVEPDSEELQLMRCSLFSLTPSCRCTTTTAS